MKTTLQDRLKQARKEAGLSQLVLGQIVGLKQSTISELETGESQSSTHLPAIAAAIGVNALWLSTGKGPKYPRDSLEPQEREILDLWRDIPESAKPLILAQFRALKEE